MPKRVRKRWRDPGYPCRDCEEYFQSFPEEERRKRINQSCRHRSEKPLAPKTPPHIWDIDFPSTPEYMAAGWLIDGDASGQSRPLRTSRRRRRWTPLQFPTKEEKTDKDKDKENNYDKDKETHTKKNEGKEDKNSFNLPDSHC